MSTCAMWNTLSIRCMVVIMHERKKQVWSLGLAEEDRPE